MSVTTILIVLIGVLATLNLFLTVGVIRRLREHTELLAKKGRREGPKVMLAPGERPETFSAVTLDGEVVTDESLTEGPLTLVGVFAHGCSSCEERRPDFVAFAKDFPGGRDRVLAVMVGEEADLADMRVMLEPVAKLMVQDRPGGPLTSAFKVTGYPAFAVFNADGTVRSSGTAVDDINLSVTYAGAR